MAMTVRLMPTGAEQCNGFKNPKHIFRDRSSFHGNKTLDLAIEIDTDTDQLNQINIWTALRCTSFYLFSLAISFDAHTHTAKHTYALKVKHKRLVCADSTKLMMGEADVRCAIPLPIALAFTSLWPTKAKQHAELWTLFWMMTTTPSAKAIIRNGTEKKILP